MKSLYNMMSLKDLNTIYALLSYFIIKMDMLMLQKLYSPKDNEYQDY